jgi:predicted CXXCH cytochrome family protein
VLAQVSLVTRRPRGGVSLKPSTVTADSLRFGRGTGSEVLLQDVRIGLIEAELQPRDGVLHLTKQGSGALRLNGDPVDAAIVKPGDEIQIGPYKITIVDPPPETDVAITVELTDPLGDDFARLQSQSVIGLDRTWLSRRRGAWIGAITVLVLFLLLPVMAYVVNPKPDPRAAPPARIVPTAVDQSWNIGEISNPHKNFARECRSCHENAFISVRDEACLTCHKGIQHHVDIKRFPNLTINTTPCGGCHQEHRGARGVITRAQSLCTDCHDDLKRSAPNAELRNVRDFGSAHPQFAVTVVADAGAKTFQRVELGGATKPVDHPNLKFSHKAHVDPVAWPREMRKLACVDCHVTEPGGGLMVPISFTKDCAECHKATLQFDAAALDRMVPHGDAALAQRSIKDFYARTALEGGVTDLSAPEIVRRRPGTPLTEPQRLEALAWADQRALAARNFVFDDLRGCGTCHDIQRNAADPKADFKIAPVLLQAHFLPKAQFNHAKHATVDCESCHAARDSVASADVLIPGIENCRTCHGGESAGAKVQSTCISCHGFHNPGTGPLGPLGKAGQTASTDK